MARANKSVCVNNIENQARRSSKQREHGKVYKITSIVCGKYHRPADTLITDKQGRTLTSEVEVEARWAEHFSEVLNTPPPTAEAPQEGGALNNKIFAEVIMQRILDAVDKRVREEQAGFRSGRGYADYFTQEASA